MEYSRFMLVNSCSPQNRVGITKLTTVSGLWSMPAMNHVWELFRRPSVGNLFQDLEQTQLPRFGRKLFQGLFTQAYLERAFRSWESALFALSQAPNLLLSFWPFSYHLVCMYCLLIHSPPLQQFSFFFFTFPVVFSPSLHDHNIASAATARHHLPLIFVVRPWQNCTTMLGPGWTHPEPLLCLPK